MFILTKTNYGYGEMMKYYILAFIMCFFQMTEPVPLASYYGVDFDKSMGKNDPYVKHYYERFVASLNKPNTSWYKFLPGKMLPQFLDLSQSLYKKNNLLEVVPDKSPRIPLIIHQIWLGSPLPDKYKAWQKTWQSIPGFTYKLWTDEDVKGLNLVNRDIYDQIKNYGQKADVLTSEILYQFGGIYVDIDFECLQPEMFVLLNHCYDFFIGITSLDESVLYANHAIIGSIKGHPYFKGYLEGLPASYADFKGSRLWDYVGPAYLSKLVIPHLGKETRDIVFPPSFLYPLGFTNARLFFSKGLSYEAIKQKVLKPESLAIHWWDGSWLGQAPT